MEDIHDGRGEESGKSLEEWKWKEAPLRWNIVKLRFQFSWHAAQESHGCSDAARST